MTTQQKLDRYDFSMRCGSELDLKRKAKLKKINERIRLFICINTFLSLLFVAIQCIRYASNLISTNQTLITCFCALSYMALSVACYKIVNAGCGE